MIKAVKKWYLKTIVLFIIQCRYIRILIWDYFLDHIMMVWKVILHPNSPPNFLKNYFLKLYKDATKDKFNFLKIDIENRDDNKKFSHNFTGFYRVDNEDSD